MSSFSKCCGRTNKWQPTIRHVRNGGYKTIWHIPKTTFPQPWRHSIVIEAHLRIEDYGERWHYDSPLIHSWSNKGMFQFKLAILTSRYYPLLVVDCRATGVDDVELGTSVASTISWMAMWTVNTMWGVLFVEIHLIRFRSSAWQYYIQCTAGAGSFKVQVRASLKMHCPCDSLSICLSSVHGTRTLQSLISLPLESMMLAGEYVDKVSETHIKFQLNASEWEMTEDEYSFAYWFESSVSFVATWLSVWDV